MKKIILLLSIVLVVFSCNKVEKEILTNSTTFKGIQNKQELYDLVKKNIYPINKLSPKAIKHFADHLTFEKDNYVKGFSFKYLTEELTEEEYYLFIQKTLGFNDDSYGDVFFNANKTNNYYEPGLPFIQWSYKDKPASTTMGDCTPSHDDKCRLSIIEPVDPDDQN